MKASVILWKCVNWFTVVVIESLLDVRYKLIQDGDSSGLSDSRQIHV